MSEKDKLYKTIRIILTVAGVIALIWVLAIAMFLFTR